MPFGNLGVCASVPRDSDRRKTNPAPLPGRLESLRYVGEQIFLYVTVPAHAHVN